MESPSDRRDGTKSPTSQGVRPSVRSYVLACVSVRPSVRSSVCQQFMSCLALFKVSFSAPAIDASVKHFIVIVLYILFKPQLQTHTIHGAIDIHFTLH